MSHKHESISRQQEAQAARNTGQRTRKPLSAAALAARERLAAATQRLRTNGGMAADIVARHESK